jgi:diguanylate cyclase (GGDEF)-like protein
VARAAAVCQAPIAAITLIDADRQCTAAIAGGDPFGGPREDALCAHTVLGTDLLVVADLADDGRFRDHHLLVGAPRARFYAGAPMLAGDGLAVGAVCVLDTVPRQLERWQLEVLEVLAQQAVSVLRLRAIEQDHADALDDLELARRNLSFLTTHDALTGLQNRQSFIRALDRAVAASNAGTETPALLVIDIDRFREVNHELGHDAGDRVLVTVADRIHLGCRGDDAVARLAGDQFAVLIRSTGTLGPASLARRLLQAVAAPVEFHGAIVSITASIGIATWNEAIRTSADFVRTAQAAARAAKDGGRARIVEAADPAAAARMARPDVAAVVRRAIETRSLQLQYSPLRSLTDGATVAHQANLRWGSDAATGVTSAAYLRAAGELNLTGEITRYTIGEAAQVAARRRAEGDAGAAVAVELSAVQLERDEVLLVVAGALVDADLEPSGLVVQLADSLGLTSSAPARATLRELQNIGVRVVLDDVGAGFSSFSLLQSFPFDYLKVDRRLVAGRTSGDEEVLASIARLGEALGMTLVAEVADVPVPNRPRVAPVAVG